MCTDLDGWTVLRQRRVKFWSCLVQRPGGPRRVRSAFDCFRAASGRADPNAMAHGESRRRLALCGADLPSPLSTPLYALLLRGGATPIEFLNT